jgi:hypothetical protein
VFFGRTWQESLGMYALDESDLKGLRILDCPGGPGGLVTWALQHGIDMVAIDPQSADDADTLERRGRASTPAE